jgi:hypothetical protein
MMIYIKSTLVGILMLVLATIVYITHAFIVMMRTYTRPPGGEIFLDLRALLSGPIYWLIALAAFAFGFIGNFAEPDEDSYPRRRSG